MQIASTCKVCPCDKCESSKKENSSNPKLSNEKCHNSRPKTFGRSRPSKTKSRFTYGNHHRLDHTYAASASSHKEENRSAKKQIVNEKREELIFDLTKDDNDEDISLKSSWLRNLCLEYQPTTATTTTIQIKDDDAVRLDKHKRFNFFGMNGSLKQYQKNRKVSKRKTDFSSAFLGKNKIVKSVQEDNKRWIAALALIELAESK